MRKGDMSTHGNLRARAEALVFQTPDISESLTREEAISLVHELQVHQVELELQNEELLRTQDLLAEARDKYQALYNFSPSGYLSIDSQGLIVEANETAAELLQLSREKLLNSHFGQYISRDDQDEYHLLRQNPAHTDNIRGREITMICADQSTFHAYVKAKVMGTDQNKLPLLHLSITNITELKQTQFAERTQRLLVETLRDSAFALNRSRSLSEILDDIIDLAKHVVSYETAELLLIDNDRAALMMSWDGLDHGPARELDPVELKDILRDMMETQEPVIIANLLAEGSRTDYPFAFSDMRSYLGIPIILDDGIIGFISVYHSDPDFFTREHADYLTHFTAHIALAIKDAKLIEESQKLAIFQERQRLARELHDNVTQMLFSSSVIAEALMKSNNIEKVRDNLGHLYRINRGALSEMNNLLLELRTNHAPEIDLSLLLKRLGEAISGRSDINVETDLVSWLELPVETQLAFYRIARRALDNVVSHSYADHVKIKLAKQNHEVVMSIEDDGQGFDPEAHGQGGGLTSIQADAKNADLGLTVSSRQGEGTQIEVKWEGE